MSRPWHTYSAEALEAEFNTNLVDGLSSAEARSRYAKNKKNNKGYDFSLFVPDGTSFLRSVLEFARNPFAIVLLILSLLTALFGRLLLGLSVFAIAVTVTVIGGIMSGRSSEKLNAVRSYSSPMVRVRRSGNLLTTDGRNLVCGDIIVLGVGDLLPCDARVIESEGLTVDELSADGKRIERKRIAKYATVLCGEDCNADIAEAENMLFAGSAVMSGWAVALVTDIGRNVYLADHLEGGDLSGKDRDTVGINHLKHYAHNISFIIAAALLVLSVIGLITLRGKSDLIGIFLLLLASVFFITSEFLLFGSNVLFSTHITKLSRSMQSKRVRDRSAVIRSIKAVDIMSGVTDLVLLGSAGLRIGEYRIGKTFTASRVVDELLPDSETARRLLSQIHTYVKAKRQHCNAENYASDGMTDAFYAYLRACGFDINGADLLLRSIYFDTDKKNGYGFAYAETNTEFYRVGLIPYKNAVKLCDHIRDGSHVRKITDNDIQAIDSFYDEATGRASSCVFVVSESENKAVFEAVLTLYQPIDPELVSAISGLKALGVTTTVMLDVENEQSIEFVSNPNLGALIGDKTVLASEYSKRESDIINEYERYSAYVGFDIDEYTAIIKRMREDGAKVAVFGIANEYNKLMAVADIAISCDTVRYSSEKYRESIYERLPAEGRDTDIRASQQTRLLSKVTVRRAHANGGGVSSVLTAVRTSRSAYVSLAQSVVLFLMLMSTLVPFAVMTVLTGNILIDPIQMVLLSSTFALLSATVFAEFEQSSKILSAKMDFTRYPFETVRGAIPGMIARASVVAASAVAIKILDVIGVFGEKASYTLPIFVCIALTLFFEVFLINLKFSQKGDGRGHCWHKVIAAYAVLLLFFAVTTVPQLTHASYAKGFGLFEFLIVPTYMLLYVLALTVLHFIESRRKMR